MLKLIPPHRPVATPTFPLTNESVTPRNILNTSQKKYRQRSMDSANVCRQRLFMPHRYDWAWLFYNIFKVRILRSMPLAFCLLTVSHFAWSRAGSKIILRETFLWRPPFQLYPTQAQGCLCLQLALAWAVTHLSSHWVMHFNEMSSICTVFAVVGTVFSSKMRHKICHINQGLS